MDDVNPIVGSRAPPICIAVPGLEPKPGWFKSEAIRPRKGAPVEPICAPHGLERRSPHPAHWFPSLESRRVGDRRFDPGSEAQGANRSENALPGLKVKAGYRHLHSKLDCVCRSR